MDFLINHWLDITTTILGLAYILLEYRASIWMWAVGAVMQVLGIVLYYQKGLYADCGMEFYYLAMTAYGFWCWTRKNQSSPATHQATPITHIPLRTALGWGTIFLVLWFVMGFNSTAQALSFQTGWFAFGIISQTLIIHMMRTNKIPFVTSFSSRELIFSTFLVTAAVLVITFTGVANIFSLSQLPLNFMLWIAILLVVYAAAIMIYKALTVKKDGSIL